MLPIYNPCFCYRGVYTIWMTTRAPTGVYGVTIHLVLSVFFCLDLAEAAEILDSRMAMMLILWYNTHPKYANDTHCWV